jgi:hypothetical protein
VNYCFECQGKEILLFQARAKGEREREREKKKQVNNCKRNRIPSLVSSFLGRTPYQKRRTCLNLLKETIHEKSRIHNGVGSETSCKEPIDCGSGMFTLRPVKHTRKREECEWTFGVSSLPMIVCEMSDEFTWRGLYWLTWKTWMPPTESSKTKARLLRIVVGLE